MSQTWRVPARKDTGAPQRELPPRGSHAARCVAVIDLGHQLRRKYQSQEREWKHLLYLGWELVDLPARPVVGREFLVSLHEKAGLRHFVDQWVGSIPDESDFDLLTLAGRPCYLSCDHERKNDKTFLRIEGATPPPMVKGQVVEVDPPQHKPLTWTLANGMESSLPDWLPYLYGRSLTDWIMDSRERRGATTPDAPDEPDQGMDSVAY